MYKVEEEEVKKKISNLKNNRFDGFLAIIAAVLVLSSITQESFVGLAISLLMFTFSFVNYYYISPTLGKIEILESEVRRLREKVGIEEEKRY